jgi:hypothetical protein
MHKIITIYIVVPKAETTQEMIDASTGGIVEENATHNLFKHEPPIDMTYQGFPHHNWESITSLIKTWRENDD